MGHTRPTTLGTQANDAHAYPFHVAGLLGNTAAVCRGSYIHPLVLESYQQGSLQLKARRSERAFEIAVLRFLEASRAEASPGGGAPRLRVQSPEVVAAGG
jgi:DNA topoisomerase IB